MSTLFVENKLKGTKNADIRDAAIVYVEMHVLIDN